MKSFGFCVLLLLFGTALVCLAKTIIRSPPDYSSPKKMIPGTALNIDKQDITVTATSRKLKGLGSTSRGKMSDSGQFNLEDYGPYDPAPSSKASIRPGPIQHGTPLNPYIPRSAPPAPPAPGHPKLGALP